MSANNDAGRERKRLCLGDDAANFVYTNLEDYVPDGVIHVRVHPSIKVIPPRAFYRRRGLTTAILNNGLEEIGERAFWGCVLVCINIPPSVRAIKNYAFYVLAASNCDFQRWAGGDLGVGIFQIQITPRNFVPPLRQGHQRFCILWLLGVGDCDSQ